jgi:hypothetical protein
MPSKPIDTISERVWIASYTASQYAGVLSRGLHFRSIHDSEADAEKMRHDPAAIDFTITEYAAISPSVSPARAFPAPITDQDRREAAHLRKPVDVTMTEQIAEYLIAGLIRDSRTRDARVESLSASLQQMTELNAKLDASVLAEYDLRLAAIVERDALRAELATLKQKERPEQAWERPAPGTRKDIVGIRTRQDGSVEYLMHNEALCWPYYIAVSPVPMEGK